MTVPLTTGEVCYQKLKQLQPGESFFVPHWKQADASFMRPIAKQLGIGIIIWSVSGDDEIYPGQHGIRVKRVS